MNNILQIQHTYIQDNDQVATKSRFGYFNMPPSCFLAHNFTQEVKHVRDQNGKVKTQNRNIFSGVSSSGVLKKNYFSYEPSYLPGDLYQNPGKKEYQQKQKEDQKFKDKAHFRPASLTKEALSTLPYEYTSLAIKAKESKVIKDQSGKVKTSKPNITSNPALKCQQTRMKAYLSESKNSKFLTLNKSQVQEQTKKIVYDYRQAFKLASFQPNGFATLKEVYGGQQSMLKIKQIIKKPVKYNKEAFKSHNHSNGTGKLDLFTKPVYMSPLKMEQKKLPRSSQIPKKQAFKPARTEQISKPTPSISLSKTNLLRGLK